MNIMLNPIHIIGIELRTTNDDGRSFQEIPPFWAHFMQENCMGQIPNKLNDDIYAVYTNFENPGKNNKGLYSLIIGCSVDANSNLVLPHGFTRVTIPAGCYRVFPVEKGRHDNVGEVWQSIWAISDNEKLDWKFSCEFERYRTTGEIDIFIGIKNQESL